MASDKLGGAHTTIIGGRTGRKAAEIVAWHPMVKRIIPSGISVNGAAGGGKTKAKVLRSDARGNLRLLISSGTVSTGTAHHNNRGGLSGRGIAEAREDCSTTWCWHGSGCCLPDAASHKYSIRQTLVSQAAA